MSNKTLMIIKQIETSMHRMIVEIEDMQNYLRARPTSLGSRYTTQPDKKKYMECKEFAKGYLDKINKLFGELQ